MLIKAHQPFTFNDAVSPPSMIFNTQLSAKLQHRNSISRDVFNILNVPVADVSYYYAS